MQAFVVDYSCDLFISAAQAGAGFTASDRADAAGWAETFGAGLKSLLGQKLGKRDWGIVFGPSTTDGVPAEEMVRKSAILVVVLTRAYLEDNACLAHLDAFTASIDASDATNRIFVALADDIPRESWPIKLRNHLAFSFLTPPDISDTELIKSHRRLDVGDKQFPVRLDDLSSELAICLERLKSHSEGTPQPELPAVYLSTPSPDAIDLRDSMRRYLTQEGFRITPNRWHPQTVAELRAAIQTDVRDAHLLVQLLGISPLPNTSDPSLSIGVVELGAAKEAGVPIVSWRDPRLDPVSIKDVAHRRVLEGEYVLAVSIEEFKRKVVEKARSHATKPATSTDQPLVVVAASEVDKTFAQQVGQLMDGKGLNIEITNKEELSWDRYSNGKQGVGGLVIVYGACPAIWVRQQLWKYRKAMARVESRPPLCAVCEGPPHAKEPLRYDVPQMGTIDCRIQITEAALTSFIEAVKRRCSQ